MVATMSHPTMGAWIEIRSSQAIMFKIWSHPTMGAWIEIFTSVLEYVFVFVAPHDGCVD